MNDNPPAPHMARRVRAALEAAGLTQIGIAEVLGLDQTTVSKRYRGITAWRAHELQLLSERFNIPVERFYRDGEPAKAAS